MDDDLRELLGSDSEEKPILISQKEAEANLRRVTAKTVRSPNITGISAEANTIYMKHPDVVELKSPIGAQRLAEIFDIPVASVRKRLEKCKVLVWTQQAGHTMPLYDFKEAIRHFLPPNEDIGKWLESQNAASLPPHIIGQYWTAMTQRGNAMRKSRKLWHDNDVLEILGRTAIMIRDETRLWIENLPEKDQMTDAQYNALMKSVSELLENVHERLVDYAKSHKTRAFDKTLIDELAEEGHVIEDEVEQDA